MDQGSRVSLGAGWGVVDYRIHNNPYRVSGNNRVTLNLFNDLWGI